MAQTVQFSTYATYHYLTLLVFAYTYFLPIAHACTQRTTHDTQVVAQVSKGMQLWILACCVRYVEQSDR